MSFADRNFEQVSMSKLSRNVWNAAEITILIIMLFFVVFYTIAINKQWAQMMSAVDLSFLNCDCVGPINISEPSCILLRVMRDMIFLNTGTMQIGLGFWCFVLFGNGYKNGRVDSGVFSKWNGSIEFIGYYFSHTFVSIF